MIINKRYKNLVCTFTMLLLSICYFMIRVHYAEIEHLISPRIVVGKYESGKLSIEWKPVEYATSYGIFKKNNCGRYELIEKTHYMKNSYKNKLYLKNCEIVVKAYYKSEFIGKDVESCFSNPIVINDKGQCRVI